MAVFQMLPEVVRTEELLGLVALAKLVYDVQVFGTNVPLRRVGELLAAIPACVCAIARGGGVVRRFNTRQGSA